MLEAIRLVQEEGYSIKQAAQTTNSRKTKAVPCTTLNDRVWAGDKGEIPAMGRPVEIPKAVEAALVKCLKMCGDLQYPMKKSDLVNLVQYYCVENGVETRWKESKPGKDWCLGFMKRWKKDIKLKRPRNIKRSRAAVSPSIMTSFHENARPHLEGIKATHIINYDETNLQVLVFP